MIIYGMKHKYVGDDGRDTWLTNDATKEYLDRNYIAFRAECPFSDFEYLNYITDGLLFKHFELIALSGKATGVFH